VTVRFACVLSQENVGGCDQANLGTTACQYRHHNVHSFTHISSCVPFLFECWSLILYRFPVPMIVLFCCHTAIGVSW
jgi:hypothetical protein